MKIAIGSDHAGFELKEHLRETLTAAGHDVKDVGTNSADSVDYPDYANLVARSVVQSEVERGILICGTGLGISMAANRVRGIRAAPCTSEYAAEMARRHNDANILALGARFITPAIAERLVTVFLITEFEGGRHQDRVTKIDSCGEEGR